MGRVLMPNGMRGFGMRRGPAKLGGALMPRAPRSGKSPDAQWHEGIWHEEGPSEAGRSPDAPGPTKQGRALMPRASRSREEP